MSFQFLTARELVRANASSSPPRSYQFSPGQKSKTRIYSLLKVWLIFGVRTCKTQMNSRPDKSITIKQIQTKGRKQAKYRRFLRQGKPEQSHLLVSFLFCCCCCCFVVVVGIERWWRNVFTDTVRLCLADRVGFKQCSWSFLLVGLKQTQTKKEIVISPSPLLQLLTYSM